MKYYRGSRRRKKSSLSPSVTSPSTSHTNTEDTTELSVETTISQSSLAEQVKLTRKKRPSSTSPLENTEEQSAGGRAKRAKLKHTISKTESDNSKKANKKVSESSDEDEPTMSKTTKKRTQRSASNRSNSGHRKSDRTSSRVALKKGITSKEINGSDSEISLSDNSKARTQRRSNSGHRKSDRTSSRVALKKGITSKEINGSDSEISLSDNSKARKTSRNSYKTVDRKAKLSNKRTPKEKELPAPTNISSETPDSTFENSKDMQREVSGKASESGLGVSSGDISSDGLLTHREFLQQQVRLLKSSFEIEDCPELAVQLQGTKRQQKNHIPRDVILKVLRRLNYKVEDDLLKTLNRQEQRKVLKEVNEIQSEQGIREKESNGENVLEPERKIVLEKTLESSLVELDGLKKLTDMAAMIESLTEKISINSLAEEVKYTNKLIQKIFQKLKKEGFANCPAATTSKGALSHKEIVDKLFS